MEWCQSLTMNNNQKKIDYLGKIIIKEIYDPCISFIKNDLKAFQQTKRFSHLFNEMSGLQKHELELLVEEVTVSIIFDFLRVFDEYEKLSLNFKNNDTITDFSDISEMLKSEIGPWIEKFSKFEHK